MKNINIKFILFLIIALFLFKPINVSAGIVDDADILTEAEEKELTVLLEKQEKNIKANIIVYTLNSNVYIDDAVDDWFVANCPTKYDGSIIYAIDMKSRTTLIIGYDDMKHLSFGDDKGIVEKTASYLRTSDNAGSVRYFIDNIDEEISKQETIRLVVMGLINLAVSVFVMFCVVRNAGGKETVNHKDYVQLGKSRIFNRRDIYLRTEVHKTRKSSSSSGGSGRSGSGGHGHF